ncbi:DUF6491 family protein [Niveispirillum fermenti]|uniref:DUF6491 family protein n=1 Tax=Niveispirillum fermenti TaxID=1233113 RepID=UPI003A837FDF
MKRQILAVLFLLMASPAWSADDPAAPATSPTTSARDICIDNGRINGWSVEDSRTIIVTQGASRRFRIELGVGAVAAGLGTQTEIAFLARPDGQLCSGWGKVLADGQRIPILSITRLVETPAAEEK